MDQTKTCPFKPCDLNGSTTAAFSKSGEFRVKRMRYGVASEQSRIIVTYQWGLKKEQDQRKITYHFESTSDQGERRITYHRGSINEGAQRKITNHFESRSDQGQRRITYHWGSINEGGQRRITYHWGSINEGGQRKITYHFESTSDQGQRRITYHWGLISEQSDKFETKTTFHKLSQKEKSDRRLSQKIKDSEADFVDSLHQNLHCYKLRVKQVCSNEEYNTRRFVLESDSEEWKTKETKLIMLAGMTGAGKTSLANQIVNFVYGVDFEDNFRLILTDKLDEKVDHSEQNELTSWISGYELQWQPGFRCPWNVFLVDTPGFGGELKQDEELVNQIQSFFEEDSICFVNEIASIGLVVSSATNRLTAESECVLDEVQNLLAKNLANNISVLLTFSSDQNSLALETLNQNRTAFNGSFCLNNVCLLASPDDETSFPLWKMSFNSLQCYFAHIGSNPASNIDSTREVLQKRQMLKLSLECLQLRIGEVIKYLRSLERMLDFLTKLKKEDIDNKNSTILYGKDEKVAVKVAYHVMNCRTCHQTCHNFCRSRVRFLCAAFNWNRTCRICDQKCPVGRHTREKKRFVSITTERKATLAEIANDFELLETPGQYCGKQILVGLIAKYRQGMNDALDILHKLVEESNELDQLALRNTALRKGVILSALVAQYQESDDPDKNHQVSLLKRLLERTDLFDDAKERRCPELLRTRTLSVYEQKVKEKLWEYYGEHDWLMVSPNGGVSDVRDRSLAFSE